ncbi:hypothetical protein ACIO6T_31110 [Streptomyces sp. NPDC087532]|uniref:hypothetical protein n=1 Tax=Streptomyces sp. NPDC087532 TaxID=3365795 RepID=UPI0037FAB2C8
MSARDNDLIVLDRLLNRADSEVVPHILAAARAARYLWQCANAVCGAHNGRGQRYCTGCGWGSNGRPVGDITPSNYEVPKRKWAALRQALTGHFAQDERRPDAVVFDYRDGPGWRGAQVTAMYGGRAEPIEGGFRDRDRFEAIGRALDGLTRFEKPGYYEHMRIVLSA